MIDFLEKWNDKVKRIEEIKAFEDDSYKKEIEEFENTITHLCIVANIFDKTECELKSIIPPNSFILQCDEDELKEKYTYYKELFADSLLEVINLDHIDMPINYNGFFSYKDKNKISKNIIELKTTFKISNEQVVDFLRLTDRYIFFNRNNRNRFLERFIFLSQYFELSYDETIILYKNYPDVFNLSPFTIQSREKGLCSIFNCEKTEIIAMYRKYIPSMYYTPTDIDLFLRFNKNRRQETKERVKKMPWIVQCGSHGCQRDYCGFGTIENLLDIAECLEKHFGKIDKVFSKNWNKTNYDIKHLLIRTNNGRFILVCLGVLTPEQMLLSKLFEGLEKKSATVPHIAIQFVTSTNEEDLKDSFIYFYGCYGCGKRGRKLKNGSCIVELKLKMINQVLSKPLFLFAEDKTLEDTTLVCVLNETLTKKHHEFFEKNKKNLNPTEEEFKDLFDDFNFDDFDSDVKLDNNIPDEQEIEKQEQTEFLDYINYVFGSKDEFESYITNHNLY